MNLEDIELDNVNRIERNLRKKYGKLPTALCKNLDLIKFNLLTYEISENHANRINSEMEQASKCRKIENASKIVKELADTFWR